MAKYFSASHVAFYDDAIIKLDQMPDDVVEIELAEYNDFMAKQCEGFVIVAGANGYPELLKQTGNACTCLAHELQTATSQALGHVKIGKNVNVMEDGTISVELAKDVGEARDRDASKPTYGLT